MEPGFGRITWTREEDARLMEAVRRFTSIDQLNQLHRPSVLSINWQAIPVYLLNGATLLDARDRWLVLTSSATPYPPLPPPPAASKIDRMPARVAPQIPLNINRQPLVEMEVAEESGQFDYRPNVDPLTAALMENPNPSTSSIPPPPLGDHKKNDDDFSDALSTPLTPIAAPTMKPTTSNTQSDFVADNLEDFDLEMEGLTLDDN